MDSRIIKTRREIRNTFLDLLKDYPYEKITIKLLCEQAYIARPTLYAHYNSIQDVLIDCVDNKFEKTNVANSFKVFNEEAFKAYFAFIRDNQHVVEVLFQRNVEGCLYRFNKKYIGKNVLSIPAFEERQDAAELTEKFLVRLSGILFVAVDQLVAHGFAQTDEEIAHATYVLATRAIDSVIEGEN